MSRTNVTPVTKYHGTGNDFLAVDAAAPVPDRAAFATSHCDRETGVRAGDGDRRGADGVLFLGLKPDRDPTRVEMTLVQPDGSTAAMCGNGARCVARWAHDRTGETEFVVGTGAGDRGATVHEDGRVTVGMGEPRFEPEAVPLARDGPLVADAVAGLTVTAVDTGVPHAVAFVDDVDAHDLDAVAEPVRHADAFPEGANVDLAAPAGERAPDDGGEPVPVFDQRTFERGVEGETRSCGTGAVAIAAVARRLGYVGGDAVVSRPPGGELELRVSGDGPATLTGPVTREFDAELAAEP